MPPVKCFLTPWSFTDGKHHKLKGFEVRNRLFTVFLSVALMGIPTAGAASDSPPANTDVVAKKSSTRSTPSGLPIPRFVALKKDHVRARFGPAFTYPVAYEFKQQGLPLKVISEDRDDIWRRVEDRDGRRMWIHRSMLAPNGHAVVNDRDAILRAAPKLEAPGRARLANGVMARIESCEDGWCRVNTGDFRGWVNAKALWGAPL